MWVSKKETGYIQFQRLTRIPFFLQNLNTFDKFLHWFFEYLFKVSITNSFLDTTKKAEEELYSFSYNGWTVNRMMFPSPEILN